MYFKLINYIHFCTTFFMKMRENMTGRAPALPIVLKWQQRDEEGDALLVASKRKENTMERASALPVVLKWQQHDEEGHAPRRRVKKGKENMTGRVAPSLSC